MGTWGCGVFENDVAEEWLDRLVEENDLGVIRESIAACLDRAELDADTAQEGLAAAALIAASRSGNRRPLPEEAREWLKQSHFTADLDLCRRAQRAAERIKTDSELVELWEHDGRWKRQLGGLVKRLKSAASAQPEAAASTTASHPPSGIDDILRHLRRKGALPDVRQGGVVGLEFDGGRLSDDDLALIAQLPDLRGVFLAFQEHITEQGIMQLAACHKLETIDLAGTAVSDAALEQLAGLPALDDLCCYKTAITDRGLAHLHRLEDLRTFDARISHVTPAGLRALQKRFPNCEIFPRVTSNGQPRQKVSANRAGFVRCPYCDRRFSIADKAAWDTKKHLSCGQLLIIAND